jgi:hypothetical protein
VIRGRARVEDEHDPGPAPIEHVSTLDERDTLEAEHGSVEVVGGLEILGVE